MAEFLLHWTMSKLVGKNVTKVANAYPNNLYLKLYFHEEPLGEQDLRKKASCIKVRYGDYYNYRRREELYYMTGMVEKLDDEDQFEALFYNFPIEENESYIVKRNGYLVKNISETENVWCDETDENFKPSKNQIKDIETQILGFKSNYDRLKIKLGNKPVCLVNVDTNNSMVLFNSQIKMRDFTANN